MKKTLLRVYDKKDELSLFGKCYFLVLPGTWDDLDDCDLECILNCITRTCWQSYTSYAVGTAEIEEDELFWSEVMDYNMHEVYVDAERVQSMKKYRLPEMYTAV